MAELGESGDPKALIPGNTDSIRTTVWSMTIYGDLLHEAGAGLQRIDTEEGWSGEAADQFRDAFDGEPARWLEAGDCFHAASKALETYISTMTWAQGQATEAIRLWDEGQAATRHAAAEHDKAVQHAPPGTAVVPFADPGEATRQTARDMLDRARAQLATAGEVAADAVGKARDRAPEEPTWLEQAASAVGTAGAHALNALASAGNAAVNHPEMILGAVGGAALTAVSAAGVAASGVLDASGVGVVAGGPLGVASAAGVATGVGMVGASIAGMATEAAGDDAIEPIDTDNSNDLPTQSTEATAWDQVVGDTPNPADIHTPEIDQIHILDGGADGTGGHFYGTGIPNKTEFPESWDDSQIIEAVEGVAKNPDSPPVLSDSGNYRFSGTRDGVEIEGYVTPEGQVKTGYPVRGEGVVQNDEFGNPHPVP
ncbi:EndoU domain-containing protein [Saccharopolyspora sp. K220]|uniref:putative T7SS-secreted protein n=1 Tax=Saccharopolyspora soli TaxID=2926618 RepID=UPI001F5984D6|nr:EndoU domain-containing protein [Saccharopolyspora soli]MCI2422695.1 EndoU domain-containing protein [Saccharopolyspora soli]